MSKTTLLELTTATEVSETQDFIPVVDVSDTTETTDGTTKKATVRKILQDKALPSGDIVGTSDEQTLSNKTLDSSNNVVEILKKVYPVGAIYISTVGTNPSTLFGFGTWEEYGSGRVLVGKSSDTEFDTIGKTGGAKTHTLTKAQMPEHRHGLLRAINKTGFSTAYAEPISGWGIPMNRSDGSNALDVITDTGDSEAHNNLPPYIVVYFFRRTA